MWNWAIDQLQVGLIPSIGLHTNAIFSELLNSEKSNADLSQLNVG